MASFFFSWWIDQNALNFSSISGLPTVRTPVHLRSLSKDRIQSGYRFGILEFGEMCCNVHLGWLGDARMREQQRIAVAGGIELRIGPGHRRNIVKLRSIDTVQTLIDASQSCGKHRAIGCHDEVFP